MFLVLNYKYNLNGVFVQLYFYCFILIVLYSLWILNQFILVRLPSTFSVGCDF